MPRRRRTPPSSAWWRRWSVRHPSRCRTPSTTTSTALTSPCPVAVGVSQDTVQFLQTHQSEYPGVTVQTVAQRTYPQGGTTATHVLGYVGDITSSYLAAHPNDGYTQGSQIGVSGIEAQYEPYLKGVAGRQALSVERQRQRRGHLELHGTADRRHRRAQHRHRAAAGGPERPAGPDPGRPQDAGPGRRRQASAGDQRGGHRHEPPERPGAAPWPPIPTYDLNEWVGGISPANFAALQQSGAENNNAIEGQYTPGSTFKLITATAALQDGLIAPTTPYVDTGTFKIQGCPASGREQRHRVYPARRPGRHRRHLQRLERPDGVERRVLLQPGRDVLGAAVQVRRRTPIQSEATRRTARGRSPASTCPVRRRDASTAT